MCGPLVKIVICKNNKKHPINQFPKHFKIAANDSPDVIVNCCCCESGDHSQGRQPMTPRVSVDLTGIWKCEEYNLNGNLKTSQNDFTGILGACMQVLESRHLYLDTVAPFRTHIGVVIYLGLKGSRLQSDPATLHGVKFTTNAEDMDPKAWAICFINPRRKKLAYDLAMLKYLTKDIVVKRFFWVEDPGFWKGFFDEKNEGIMEKSSFKTVAFQDPAELCGHYAAFKPDILATITGRLFSEEPRERPVIIRLKGNVKPIPFEKESGSFEHVISTACYEIAEHKFSIKLQ